MDKTALAMSAGTAKNNCATTVRMNAESRPDSSQQVGEARTAKFLELSSAAADGSRLLDVATSAMPDAAQFTNTKAELRNQSVMSQTGLSQCKTRLQPKDLTGSSGQHHGGILKHQIRQMSLYSADTNSNIR